MLASRLRLRGVEQLVLPGGEVGVLERLGPELAGPGGRRIGAAELADQIVERPGVGRQGGQADEQQVAVRRGGEEKGCERSVHVAGPIAEQGPAELLQSVLDGRREARGIEGGEVALAAPREARVTHHLERDGHPGQATECGAQDLVPLDDAGERRPEQPAVQ